MIYNELKYKTRLIEIKIYAKNQINNLNIWFNRFINCKKKIKLT